MSSIVRIDTRPAIFVREHASTWVARCYDADDTEITPTSWTMALRDERGTTVASTSGTGLASWEYTAASSVGLSDDYSLRLVITESDGSTTPQDVEASVCLRKLHRVIGLDDLKKRIPRLALDTSEPLIAVDAAESKARQLEAIDEAFDDIEMWLRQQGNRSHLAISPYDLKPLHVAWSIFILLDGVGSALGGESRDIALDWERRVEEAKKAVTLRYAPADNIGTGDRRKQKPQIHMGGAWTDDGRYASPPRRWTR